MFDDAIRRGEEDYADCVDFEELESRVENLESEVGGLKTRIESVGERLKGLDEQILATGYGFGATLAIVLSWSRNGSILWCILHGILSWAYVIYFAITR